MFTSPHKMTEQAITMTQELLAAPEVTEALGEEAMRLSAQLDGAFIPNNTFGRLSVPRDQLNTDNAAILAVKPMQSLYLGRGFDRFTPGQLAAAEAFVASHEDGPSLQELEEELAANKNQWWTFVGIGKYRVGTSTIPPEYWPSGGNINVDFEVGEQVITAGPNKGFTEPQVSGMGRPLILLPYDVPGKSPASKRPEVVIHEAVHARQAIEEPLLWIDPVYGKLLSYRRRGVRKELEAYRPDAKVSEILIQRGECEELESAEFALEVESAREQYAPADDPFYPTKAMLDFFEVKFHDDQTGPLREG